MRDRLKPVLSGFNASNHVSELGPNYRLGVQGFPKDYPLVRPLEAFLHYPPLSTQACPAYHPSFVVEVAENDLQALVDRSQCIRYRYPDIGESDIGCPSGRRVGSFDSFGFDVIISRDEDDGETFLDCCQRDTDRYIYSQAYIGLAANSEVVSECAVSDPLLRAVDDPFIALTDGCGLEPADVASREGL